MSIDTASSVATLKEEARRLRVELDAKGTRISHSQALERIAQQLECRDWNTLFATAVNGLMQRLTVGQTVNGHYLTQPFTAQVVEVDHLDSDRYRLRLKFIEPVDVVTSDRFTGYRKQVYCTIDRTGATREKTSDGQPHLRLA